MVHDFEATLSEEVGLAEEQLGLSLPILRKMKNRGEGEGRPQVSQEHLDQLDADAAIAEIKKLHDLDVIMSVTPDPYSVFYTT